MKKLTLALLLQFFLVGVCLAATASDLFDRADNADLGANWDNGYSFGVACQILGNAAANATVDNACIESWNANSFTDAQFSEITIGAITGAGVCDMAAIVRAQSPASMPMVVFRAFLNEPFGVTSKMFMYDNTETGHDLAISFSESWAPGDKLKGTVNGTVVTMYRNNVSIMTCDWATTCGDAPITGPSSGRVGLWVATNTAESFSDCTIASWRGGDGDGTGGTAVVRHRPIVIQ